MNNHFKLHWCLTSVLFIILSFCVSAQVKIPKWAVHEIQLQADEKYENPYLEASVTAQFVGPNGEKMTVPGFWKGERNFGIRFTPTAEGTWTYKTVSENKGLDGQTGALQVTPPSPNVHGFVRVDAQHSYHFVYDDQTRYFMLGTTYYEILANAISGNNWQQALKGSASYGINKVRMNVGEGSDDDRGAGFPDASPYVNGNHDRLDLSHFERLDEVVEQMQELEMVADFILFWNQESNYGTVEQDERFVRYVLARYAAYPNVIWCLSNEWNYTKKPREYWNEMGRLVQTGDPWLENGEYLRPLSIHHQTRIDFQYFDQEWPTTAIVQYGVRNGQGIVVDEWSDVEANKAKYVHGDDWGWHSIMYNRGHNMPIINDEYGYFGEPKDRSADNVPLTRDKHRRILWGIYMAGGYAAAGDKYQYENPPGRPYFAANWHEAEEYEDIQHLKTFFTAGDLDFYKMRPLPDAIMEGERVYMLGESGEQYVIYAAIGGRFTVELEDGEYHVIRYNPRTGQSQSYAKTKSGKQTFNVPTGEDWVLQIIRADAIRK